MNFHFKHMNLLNAANYASDERSHYAALQKLYGWREGIKDAGVRLDLCAADLDYMSSGVEREMCAGVWLDWTPTSPASSSVPPDTSASSLRQPCPE